MSDSLEQHRRELDATLAALQAIRDHAHKAHENDVAVWEAIAELREEIRAVAHRTPERITR